MILFVIQVVTTLGCIASIWINMRAWRRWNRHAETDRTIARRASVTLALVLERFGAFIDCDDCGVRLDINDSVGVGVTDTDGHPEVQLYCPNCSALHGPGPAPPQPH